MREHLQLVLLFLNRCIRQWFLRIILSNSYWKELAVGVKKCAEWFLISGRRILAVDIFQSARDFVKYTLNLNIRTKIYKNCERSLTIFVQ